MSTEARNNILTKIKQALAQPVPVPFTDVVPQSELFHPLNKDIATEFAENFVKLQGQFAYCADIKELATQLNMLFIQRNWNNTFCCEKLLREQLIAGGFSAMHATDVAESDAAITGCEYLVARTGSIFMSSAQSSGRTVSVYAPIHICIAFTDQLVYDIADGLKFMQEKHAAQWPSMVTLASGPSRTADIEKTLVVGVHGPKEVFCFLVERNNT